MNLNVVLNPSNWNLDRKNKKRERKLDGLEIALSAHPSPSAAWPSSAVGDDTWAPPARHCATPDSSSPHRSTGPLVRISPFPRLVANRSRGRRSPLAAHGGRAAICGVH